MEIDITAPLDVVQWKRRGEVGYRAVDNTEVTKAIGGCKVWRREGGEVHSQAPRGREIEQSYLCVSMKEFWIRELGIGGVGKPRAVAVRVA